MASEFSTTPRILGMKVAHDLFAETNPAFGTYIIVEFCREFCSISPKSPSIALVYLAVPIALSRDTERSFAGTNIQTGLIAWLNRYPDVRLDIGTRLNASLDVVSASLKLGITSKALALVEGGAIGLGPNPPIKSPVDRLSKEPKNVIRRARRLGHWMGEAGTAGAIFSVFGVSL